jgi:peptidoglycan/LPS O-acetylase OafA/YrhL
VNHQRLPGLDVLRALAIAWVMAYHLVSYGPRFGPVLGPVADLGWMGVDLFFVLSGFLVGGQVFAACAAPGGPRWGDYLLRRALRVLPAYLAVLGLYLWIPDWRESPGMQPAWQFLSFTANLFPDYFRNRAFSHAWSLCVEEHFYLLLPLAVMALSRRPGLHKSALFVLALLLGGIAARAWAWHTQVAPWLHVNAGEDWFLLRYIEHVYNPTWARLDGLLAGAALAAIRLWRPAWWRWMTDRGWIFLAAGMLLVGAAARLFQGFVSEAGAVFGFPLLSLGLGCVLVGMASPRILPGRTGLPGARLLATLAFSLYLTHKPVYHLVSEHAGAFVEGSNLLALACYGAAALAAGALLYLAVERPGLRLRERLARPVAVAVSRSRAGSW